MAFSFFKSKSASATHIHGANVHKERAAQSSVLAALGLVGMKITVGLATGSLGILAEAAHSGLDLVAAIVTFFAVRISAVPADQDHPYGHGKVENISALFETLLLLMTCVWIIYEASNRLISHRVAIEVNVWSYLVMIISIVVDVSRSRMLHRVAKQYNSQALEADALHFSTDIWSSAVVIVGLVCVSLSDVIRGSDFLHYADSIAAIVVAIIVVQVSMRLGRRTVNALLDSAPEGLSARVIVAVEKIPGVVNCHNVRVRASGAQVFVDLHVLLDGAMSLREAHHMTEVIESSIRELEPNADVTVHPEPR
ncbi:MAG: cation transporter [Candidatus Omnitrophica bacterium]|nr:cation transporter [Candidatus Omnitrophota bacterium]